LGHHHHHHHHRIPESPNPRNNVSRGARNKIEKRAFLPIMGKNTLLCWWNYGHLLSEKTGIRKKYGHSHTRRLFSDKIGMPSAGQDGRPSAYLLLGVRGAKPTGHSLGDWSHYGTSLLGSHFPKTSDLDDLRLSSKHVQES